jgi:hypothetical protein
MARLADIDVDFAEYVSDSDRRTLSAVTVSACPADIVSAGVGAAGRLRT